MNGLGMLAGLQGFAAGIPLGQQLVGADPESRKLEAERASAKARGLQEAFKTQMDIQRYLAERDDKQADFDLRRAELNLQGQRHTDTVAHNIAQEAQDRQELERLRDNDLFTQGIQRSQEQRAAADAAWEAENRRREEDFRAYKGKIGTIWRNLEDPGYQMSPAEFEAVKTYLPGFLSKALTPNAAQHEAALRKASTQFLKDRKPENFSAPDVLEAYNTLLGEEINAPRGARIPGKGAIADIKLTQLVPVDGRGVAFKVNVTTDTGETYPTWLTQDRQVIGPNNDAVPPPEALVLSPEEAVLANRGISQIVRGQRERLPQLRRVQEEFQAAAGAKTPEEFQAKVIEYRNQRGDKEAEAARRDSASLRDQLKAYMSVAFMKPEDELALYTGDEDLAPEKQRALTLDAHDRQAKFLAAANDFIDRNPGASWAQVHQYAESKAPVSMLRALADVRRPSSSDPYADQVMKGVRPEDRTWVEQRKEQLAKDVRGVPVRSPEFYKIISTFRAEMRARGYD